VLARMKSKSHLFNFVCRKSHFSLRRREVGHPKLDTQGRPCPCKTRRDKGLTGHLRW
jgi:hypothetical protein